MQVRNSVAVQNISAALTNIDVEIAGIDIPKPIESAILSFNSCVDKRINTWVTMSNNPRPMFTVLSPVFSLSASERDSFEALLLSYAGWAVIAGDRQYVLFGPAQDYTKEQLDLYLRNYMIYNGRFCHRCHVFTEYYANKGIWSCPICDAKVGCHKDTDVAFGSVADQATADVRKKTHQKIDSIWKSDIMSRQDVYKEMSNLLGIHRCYTHIAMLSTEQCAIVRKWANAVLKNGGIS